MSPDRKPKNLPASVRGRLLQVSRARREEFQLTLSDYAIERFLYRLGASSHAASFVLKGAMLLRIWSAERYRATWDLDLLGRGVDSVDSVVAVIRDLCAIPCDDGIAFDPASVSGAEIRAGDEYAGVRATLTAELAGARIPVQVDVGFGDTVIPSPRVEVYPTLLDQPPPRVLVYPREAVVAEKVEAMVSLGFLNSRMKDFYDVHLLATEFAFEGQILARALKGTFERRSTEIPEPELLVLSDAFLTAPDRENQWRAFRRRSRVQSAPAEIKPLGALLRAFVEPLLDAVRRNAQFARRWPAGGPWQPESDGGRRDG